MLLEWRRRAVTRSFVAAAAAELALRQLARLAAVAGIVA
jgi:hypothetical protein